MKINKEGYRIIAVSGLICLLFWSLIYYFENNHSGTGLLVTSTARGFLVLHRGVFPRAAPREDT